MTTQNSVTESPIPQAELYQRILVALDSSDHANTAAQTAIALAGLTDAAKITGTHAYAAKLHDLRFRQMEGGLPEQFRAEQELERQRDVHDDLITRGLSIITDSYLDQAERGCRDKGIPFQRRALEGKNYRELVRETNSGAYDLLIMGALGLGAVEGSRLGTVCQRVARRTDIDTLVIKEPGRDITEGPILVAIDGSKKSFGGLLTALALAREWQVPLHVVSAFDPYYHYVAFNRIAGVLSEEAGKVFRFKQQEKLHEEIIDSGLAKIYQGHLDVAESIAQEHRANIEIALLDGKPHDAIERYLEKLKPSLLVIGKLGIHADEELDIGGNAENLLMNVGCAVLLSQREHQPALDIVAETTTSWTREAEQRMTRVPEFVRNMARMAILRYAQQQGHTVITERIVEEATAQLMPSHAERAMEEIVAAHDAGELNSTDNEQGLTLPCSEPAEALLQSITEGAIRENIRNRAEKKARVAGADEVLAEHVEAFTADQTAETQQQTPPLHWQSAALARLMRVPEGFMRDASRQRIEDYAREQDADEISLDIAEAGLARARKAMEEGMARKDSNSVATDTETPKPTGSGCPFAAMLESETSDSPTWSAEAEARLQSIPQGMSRDMTRKAVETIGGGQGLTEISAEFLTQVLDTFSRGSGTATETLPWDSTARARIQKAPPMVRGMLIKEIEAWVQRQGLLQVDANSVSTIVDEWAQSGHFHLDPDDPRSGA